MTRKQIEKKIQKNKQKIRLLEQDNRNLFLQSLELSDKDQWYIEKEQVVKIRECGKIRKETWIVGFINWNEKHMDQDTGKVFYIERCSEVKRNGIWIV